jgi:hypothetical protein
METFTAWGWVNRAVIGHRNEITFPCIAFHCPDLCFCIVHEPDDSTIANAEQMWRSSGIKRDYE